MEEKQNTPLHDFSLDKFQKISDKMVIKTSNASGKYLSDWNIRMKRMRNYSKEEIESILNSGSVAKQRELSKNYFYKDGLYKRIVLYYATLLKYVGILIPNPTAGTSLSTSHIAKRYNGALDYIDRMFIPDLLTQFSINVLVNGCYYGVIQEASKTSFVLLDLPAEYCRSQFRDLYGNDIIEFDILYFDSIIDEEVRKQALKVYPKVISDHYRRYKKSQVKSTWVRIPSDIGFCFPFSDDGRPLFLDVIPAAMAYDEAVDLDRERDLDEIRKIIVQKIPHLSDGMLLFEPDEAEVMHSGAVGMLSGNKNISVLTTYADVDAVVSKTSSEAVTNTLEKNLQNVYSKTGASQQLFSPTGSQALPTSIKNDMALMMVLARKYARFISFIVNNLYANTSISFRYDILPVTWYNDSEYIADTLKLAQSGYSFLLPCIAAGLSQKDLVNLKHLENDALGLTELLIPLASSYTQSSNEVGAPEKKLEEKAPKTLQNEESLDNH